MPKRIPICPECKVIVGDCDCSFHCPSCNEIGKYNNDSIICPTDECRVGRFYTQ